MPWPLNNPRWTPEKLDELRELVAHPDKYSAAKIADLLHVKRNAVIGACYRSGIKLQGLPSGGRKKGVPQPRPKKLKWTPKPEAKMQVELPFGSARNVTFDQLSQLDCRYPTGDGPFLFCGNPVQNDSSYCPCHHRLCQYKPHRLSDEAVAQRIATATNNLRKGKVKFNFVRKVA